LWKLEKPLGNPDLGETDPREDVSLHQTPSVWCKVCLPNTKISVGMTESRGADQDNKRFYQNKELRSRKVLRAWRDSAEVFPTTCGLHMSLLQKEGC